MSVSIIPEADIEIDIEVASRRLSSVNRATSSALKKKKEEERIVVRRISRAQAIGRGDDTTGKRCRSKKSRR